MKLIGIAGRKGSGKTTIGKELLSCGYIRVSFADFLKETCSKLFNINIEKFYDALEKEKIFDVHCLWNIDKCMELSDLANLDLNFVVNKKLKNIREMLQFVGTDVLRKHDSNIHIRKTKERIANLEKCFFDDIRFSNEREMIEEMGGICIYLFRPSNWDYSNHESETSLLRTDFNYVLINNTN
jgi:cytidylate kinase